MAIENPEVGVTTSITVTPCAEAIEFYKEAFGAREAATRMQMPDGSVAHAEIEIQGTRIMLGDEWPGAANRSPKTLGGISAVLFIYTDDVESAWRRAIDAGCTEVFPLEDQFYGDRQGRVEDPFGLQWALGQQMEKLTDEEVAARADAWMGETG